VAAMFLRNKDKLQAAPESIEKSLTLDLAGFVTPLAGNVSNEVTLDFIASTKDASSPLVIVAVVPYEVGDLSKGPGARFVPLENPSFTLQPGERHQFSVKALRERIPVPSPGPPQGGSPPLPGPGGPAGPASPLSPSKLEAAGGGGGPVDSAKRSYDLAADTPPTPLFDPSLGLKVLVVVQEASVVDANVVSRVRAVPDGDFQREYGNFSKREFAIPVPPQQIL
jgi:hypothetical protein